MPAKDKTARPWTARDVRMLKGFTKQKLGVEKISKKLKRTVPAVKMYASKIGVSLNAS